MRIAIPDLSLVVLIGASGSGKSSFARKHFRSTEVLSSDALRGWVADNEVDQTVSKEAFEVLHFIAAKRLQLARLSVVDATNVQPEARKPLVELARQYHCIPVAIVFNLPERICFERNRYRPDRSFGPHVIRRQVQSLRRSLRELKHEGFRKVYVLSSVEEIEAAAIVREPLWTDRRDLHGPFDIIGDVHGCCDELETLLAKLGYEQAHVLPEGRVTGSAAYRHPAGRKAVFLGDLGDRGPRIVDTLTLVRNMVDAGTALLVPGNHDMKLLRKLKGKDVRMTHGFDRTLTELDALPDHKREQYLKELTTFLDELISHYVLDDGKLVVAHAGLTEELQGRASSRVRDFALYGESTGETDEFGLPIRYNWAADYRGRALVVYGHTPLPEAEWVNGTINIDTGCVFGGRLTALRYPERELVSVTAKHTYYASPRPLAPLEAQALALIEQRQPDVLDIDDVTGKRIINTRLQHNVTVREENAAAALEVMSRFACDPHWLIYLPPTMSPPETSRREGLLEHPAEAFNAYLNWGVPRVVCEEKHMGSRAVLIVCRDEAVARKRFGVQGEFGICYTRTGRRFFDDRALEVELLNRVRAAIDATKLWDELKSDWFCFDGELLPWSAKAQGLLQSQYAAVGASARNALSASLAQLQAATSRGVDAGALLERYRTRHDMAERYVEAYRRYCWPVASIDDLKLAPFHLLASEGAVHIDRDHVWHMQTLARLCQAEDRLLLATPYKVIDVTDARSQEEGVRWWEELTGAGGEGIVVKPFDFVVRGQRGLVQPGVKCRGREYLRIIYGAEYTAPGNLERLRARGLGHKRALALREFSLGVEALERFTRREPLYRIHECVFGVLALESEPVDPRL